MRLIYPDPSIHKIHSFSSKVPAGFPSPAEGYEEKRLSLDDLLISNPLATFFVEMEGDSMIEANIQTGDIAVVDRSLQAKHNDIVLAYIEASGFTIKRLIKRSGKVFLYPANKKYTPIEISEFIEVRIWGVVTGIVRKCL